METLSVSVPDACGGSHAFTSRLAVREASGFDSVSVEIREEGTGYVVVIEASWDQHPARQRFDVVATCEEAIELGLFTYSMLNDEARTPSGAADPETADSTPTPVTPPTALNEPTSTVSVEATQAQQPFSTPIDTPPARLDDGRSLQLGLSAGTEYGSGTQLTNSLGLGLFFDAARLRFGLEGVYGLPQYEPEYELTIQRGSAALSSCLWGVGSRLRVAGCGKVTAHTLSAVSPRSGVDAQPTTAWGSLGVAGVVQLNLGDWTALELEPGIAWAPKVPTVVYATADDRAPLDQWEASLRLRLLFDALTSNNGNDGGVATANLWSAL